MIKDSIKSVYLIAICGTGMTALAGLLKEQGYQVSGSDENVYPPMSTFLEENGIPVHIGYDPSHLDANPDLVVVGNAMSRGNPEVEAMLERKLLYVSLPFALRELFIRGKYSCVVAGTHGKTTTSSLLSWVLESADRDPGFFIGGIPENFGRGFKSGGGEFFVSEGDEYDSAFFDKGSKFLHYLPDLVILNNVEFDHADIFRTFDDVEITFRRLINLIPRNGYLIAGWDDPVVRRLSEKAFSSVVSFGLGDDAEWRAAGIRSDSDGTAFDAIHKGSKYLTVRTPLHGAHMVRNCLAVVASCHALGLTREEIGQGLATFKNVRRRLQLKGEANGIRIFDDFAHHPTEVAATISAMRSRFPGQRLWALFEPRTATSKRNLFEQNFIEALAGADQVVLTPLYASEKVPEIERLSLERVLDGLKGKGVPGQLLPADEQMVAYLKRNLRYGDVVLFMSNGDFNQIPLKLLKVI